MHDIFKNYFQHVQPMLLLVRCTHQSMPIYKVDSVSRAESLSANCRRYPDHLQADLFTREYIHCDGTQLKLTDSDLGQMQYQTTDYYVWLAGSAAQLLFIFSTRVSLTTITLHYFSDSVTGLPRLSFYAVPDDFDVWDAPYTTYPRVDVASVPPGREPAGRRNVSININFNTKRVLMYIYRHTFTFSVSEVEFFICKLFWYPIITSTTNDYDNPCMHAQVEMQ